MAKKEKGDPVILSGDVKYRMEDLLKRRRGAGLAGQHRELQRYDKELMILRAALGMPPQPPKETVRTLKSERDPTSSENLVIASAENDVPWIRRVTIKNLARLQSALYNKGYQYSIEKASSLTKYIWRGFKNGKPDNLIVTMIDRDWAIAAERNGENLNCFIFNDKAETAAEKGIPTSLAKKDWDGILQDNVKQQYAADWAALLKTI